MLREFIQSKTFHSQMVGLNAEAEFNDLMNLLVQHPNLGDVIPGTRGLRKIRMALPGRGKRGGARVIYYDVSDLKRILFLSVYAKNEAEDLTSSQLKKLIKVRDELVVKLRGNKDVKNTR